MPRVVFIYLFIYLKHSAKHLNTVLSDATLPATIMYDREQPLTKRDASSEPAASVCHTLCQLEYTVVCLVSRSEKRNAVIGLDAGNNKVGQF